MRKITQTLVRIGQKLVVFLVEDVGFYVYLIAFVVIVFGLGALYTFLTPFGHGIGQNSVPFPNVTLAQGVYFSVVTVSSLGYGDLHPMGASKAFVCIEVLFGLTVMGIMIAKVTSRRVSYHVQRLFSSDAQKRLEELTLGFDTCQNELLEMMKELGRIYQATPAGMAGENRLEVLSRLRRVLSTLNSRSSALAGYLSYELQQSAYFSIAPVEAVVRVGDAVDRALLVLGQLIISQSPQARTDTLDRQNRQHISEAIESQKSVCRIVHQHASDRSMTQVFERIQETCDKVPESYFAVPEHAQPDQAIEDSDEPKESIGNENTVLNQHGQT
jgi:hypothetical protein